MKLRRYKYGLRHLFFATSLLVLVFFSNQVSADVTLNILAVNGTEKEKDKDVKQHLPPDIALEDIVETGGLEIDYDVHVGAYYVHGSVTLAPKETRTYRVVIRDIWKIDYEEIERIKTEIDSNLERIEGSKYYDSGLVKKDSLLKRLNAIVELQKKYAESVDKRIGAYKTYADEINKIRNMAVSVHYWRSKPPTPRKDNVIRLVIEAENPRDKVKTFLHRHHLPEEVKPELLVAIEDQGFDVFYDAQKEVYYLAKEEEFQPKEVKQYTIQIIDRWFIPQDEIDRLKERTRAAYEILRLSDYKENADYLVANIKEHLKKVELSQEKKKPIKRHIKDYRLNKEDFEIARKDVEALEAILLVVREVLERSPLKNVLQRIKSLTGVAKVSEAILGKPWTMDVVWKVIIGILFFVAFITGAYFAMWGKDAGKSLIQEKEEEDATEEK